MKRESWEMSGVLGPNRLREGGDEPTHRGHCIIGDASFLISGWCKEDPQGDYLLLTFCELEASEDRAVHGD